MTTRRASLISWTVLVALMHGCAGSLEHKDLTPRPETDDSPTDSDSCSSPGIWDTLPDTDPTSYDTCRRPLHCWRRCNPTCPDLRTYLDVFVGDLPHQVATCEDGSTVVVSPETGLSEKVHFDLNGDVLGLVDRTDTLTFCDGTSESVVYGRRPANCTDGINWDTGPASPETDMADHTDEGQGSLIPPGKPAPWRRHDTDSEHSGALALALLALSITAVLGGDRRARSLHPPLVNPPLHRFDR
jgi:hypothetical protein